MNRLTHNVLLETDSDHAHYQVVEMVYNNRPARLLLSGHGLSAQSGIALDGDPRLLFDYNQYFFELVAGLNPVSVLLIGGGVYTLPMALLNAFPSLFITVVEPDASLDRIASRYFNFREDPHLTLIHTDGRSYLNHARKEFELILIDAFQGDKVPDSLADETAIRALANLTAPGASVAQNIIAPYSGPTSGPLRGRVALYKKFFETVSVTPVDTRVPRWTSQNLVIQAIRSSVDN
jgi:spermidine synthase